MRRSFASVLTAIAIGSSLTLAGCSGTTPPVDSSGSPSGPSAATSVSASPTGTPIRIGLEAPLSGDQKPTGVGMLNGATLAAEQLNAKGGINGRPIHIIPIDDAADAATGVAAATAAIAAGLDGVVGPYNSGVGMQTLPLYLKAGLTPIRLTSNSATNSMGYTLQPMDYQIAPVAAEGLMNWLSAKKVAIVYDSSQSYTTDIATKLKGALAGGGIKVTTFEAVTPGEKSYVAQVKAAAALNPDVIYVATYFPEGALIANAIYDQKVKAKCVVDFASDDPGFITNAGRAAATNCTVVGVPSPIDFPDAVKFNADYKFAFAAEAGTWSPYTYDSVNVLAAAAAATGGFDAAALTGFFNKLKDWPGVTGAVSFDPATENRSPATVVFLDVDHGGEFHVDKAWAVSTGAHY